MTPRNRSRIVLLLIAVVFFGSFGVAAWLRFSGWTPAGGTNYGTLLSPPVDVRAIAIRNADGSAYAWQAPTHPWRIVVFAPPRCGAPCVELSQALERVWRTSGRRANRVQVLWFGELPEAAARFRNLLAMRDEPALRAAIADQSAAGALPVYLIDPNGFVALRYDSGFDAAGLRRDLGRLLK